MVHAAATGCRERSYFDGQDVLESSQPGPGHTASGWLNRLVAALPAGEGRDLAPTTDVRAVAKGLAADLFGLSPAVLARSVFPGTELLRPVGGLAV
ncbi:hypothetical protein [Methylobacterium frigidaeris]|uniref:Uncharacterized protein n=1 Tax=Methylobacterium frigidaeris TaxID=2038277 RepID=A0AA37HC00_9HYPH|nr:hypothetical protein [Methylobacterium frigidaeris]PIK73006.1 hypothetical protein CS379_10800 [Methylobacterium frigidaeris]GJD63121.1 hypothetical protein MPEAHAMD_3283 [Methylobacterium frigidaeris]